MLEPLHLGPLPGLERRAALRLPGELRRLCPEECRLCKCVHPSFDSTKERQHYAKLDMPLTPGSLENPLEATQGVAPKPQESVTSGGC